MDTREIEADLRGAEAKLKQAQESKKYAMAVVSQSQSELSYATKQYKRSQTMFRKKLVSKEQLDRDKTNYHKADAVWRAATFKVSESNAVIDATRANIDKLKTLLAESILKSPVNGRVLYRLSEPGEVLAAGGHVLTLLNLTDVYMTIFLPARDAGRVPLNADARIVLDARPDLRIPANVSFVAPKAQFTPKEVETRSERDKLMFRIKVSVTPAFLKKNLQQIKTGITGVAYIRFDSKAQWPEFLQVKSPE
jgi:HlyD family secretion protein